MVYRGYLWNEVSLTLFRGDVTLDPFYLLYCVAGERAISYS